ncbi:MAG: YicC/YloC family endoribonuclease [Bacteroidota bacterium]
MILSMTGYGKRTFQHGEKSYSIEIRSLNGKQFDINLKIPQHLREKELELRNLLAGLLKRGKIEITITQENEEAQATPVINKAIAKQYYDQILALSDELQINEQENVIYSLLRMPDVLKPAKEGLDEQEWATLLQNISAAATELTSFRLQEGKSLAKDIVDRIKNIQDNLAAISPYEGKRLTNVRERIRNNLNDFLANDKVDENRFEQEIIFYLEKMDITEEKVRLTNHCQYFIETMEHEEPMGKKLGFIAQEIGREINTIGSKANDSDIQRHVVMMKDELEKIKEQLMNVM